ncbi:MAG: radical SAM protein [Eggerthellaceae bacterium]|nr:radical SAM protein [Eggerthellaceae bacterium]
MKFHSEVVLFDFEGISLIGNYDTGYVIGLTDEGFKVCKKALMSDVGKEEFDSVDPLLFKHLSLGKFFNRITRKDNLLESAYLHVTQHCNLSCKGCYSDNNQRNKIPDAPLKDIKKALNDLAKCGVKDLIISGGEPFLRKDLPEIIRYAKEKCCISSITVLTNGTVVDDAVLMQMRECVDKISVSFDGYSNSCPAYIRKTQRFNELVGTIKKIQRVGIPVHIIPTIHSKNINDLKEYLALSSSLGVTLNFSLLSCETSNELKELILSNDDQIKLAEEIFSANQTDSFSIADSPIGVNISVKKHCGAGRSTINIGADGRVFPCHLLYYDELTFGNIFADSLSDILEGSKAVEFSKAIENPCVSEGDCRFLPLCGGGCRGRAYLESKSLSAKDSYCCMNKRYFELLGEYLKKRTSNKVR